MATKRAGGRITGLLALTLEAQVAMSVGDPVMVTGPYECGLADGSKPVVGIVSVANVTRNGPSYPVSNVPGDVTVEARGVAVWTMTSGGAFGAGVAVGIDNTGALVEAGVGVATIGVSLMAATDADEQVDVLATAGV